MTQNIMSAAAGTIRVESCSLALALRISAMLDLDSDALAEGQPLPRGWHFPLLAGDTHRSQLRSDGFPGLGVPMPDLDLPRLLLAGRSIAWSGDIIIGDTVTRSSQLVDVVEKQGASGRMALVNLRHELRTQANPDPVLIETQTYALLPAVPNGAHKSSTPCPEASANARSLAVVPDQTLLFQYSALGFNSHKIHLDRDHARRVEGLPDLVVNGGLTTLLATEFLRRELGVTPRSLRARYMAPLYCDRPLTLRAEPTEAGWRLHVLDNANTFAAELEVLT